jgi:hypothetical protein
MDDESSPFPGPDGFRNILSPDLDGDGEIDDVNVSLALADASYPVAKLGANNDPSDDEPETGYLYIGGFTEMLPGGALQMAAGYEGKGKGSAGGGVAKIIDIYSRFQGALNSQSTVLFGWRHLIGSEGSCNYGP